MKAAGRGGSTRGRVAPWVAVGPSAAGALEKALPPDVSLRRVEDVHEAILVLGEQIAAGCVVSGDVLLHRPRAALRSLRKSVGEGRLVILGAPATEAAARAAESLGVEVLDHVASVLAPARPGVPATRPSARPLPRADDAATGPRAVDAGAFAEGCLDRIHRPGALARYVIRSLAEASAAARVSLMLVERGGKALRLRAAQGLNPALMGKVRCLLGAGLAGRVAALGRPMAGHGTTGGPRAYPGRAYVVLPLGREGHCEGVLSLTGLPQDELPDAETLRTWVRVCRRAGVALAGARRLRRAEALSSTDALTGLPNRRAFERALAREIERARRSGLGLAVGILDVDRFKAVNDQYGHQVGDRVLTQVARRLAGSFRETDLVARWGGEEFAVLLPGLTHDGAGEAVRALERARRAVGSAPLPLGPGLPSCAVTISGGLALHPSAGTDAASLVRAADQALYAAKDAGRNVVKTA